MVAARRITPTNSNPSRIKPHSERVGTAAPPLMLADSDMSVGLPASLEAMRRVVDLAPLPLARKLTRMVQLLPPEMVGVRLAQPSAVTVNWAASAPVAEMLLTFKLPPPLLVMVKVCAVVLPGATLP